MPHRSIVAFLCICFMSTAAIVGLQPEASGQSRPASSPDVLILVYSGMGPFDQVSINYTGAVPADQARRDIAEIKRLTGWLIRSEAVTTEATSAPGAKPTTSSKFEAPPLANATQGTLPLEPFATALKRFGSVQVIYLMPSGFPFRGLEDFENDYVKINLKKSGDAYTYRIDIKNRDFDRLGLPLRVEEPVKTKSTGMPAGARFLLVFGVAVAGGVLVYFVVALVGARKAGRQKG